MSARLLKKVLKEQEEQQLKQLQEVVVEEDEERGEGNQIHGNDASDSPKSHSVNPFDLLNDGDDDQDDIAEIDPQQESGQKSTEQTSVLRNSTNVVSMSNNKSKKKKKKKGKEGSSSTTDKIEEEKTLDMLLESLSLDGNNPSTSSSSSKQHVRAKEKNAVHEKDYSKQSVPSILRVDAKYLNAENELRRIFGSKVVESFEKKNRAGSSRQVHGARRVSLHARKTILVTPSEHWPRWDGSLSMEFLETKDGHHQFRYVHLPSYAQAQRAFEDAKSSHDLNSIASILLYHPYHLDSLKTMADYFKFAGDHEMSADAIAKILYALSSAWHPMFTPLQANCQLKFSHDTNKPIFTTLFTHMKNLDRRGCHRSALEVCKLLLSLDSDDPMGAMFFIDYLSLRAEEYAWLERFSEEYGSDSSLWLFPNFSYSLAICRFYLERGESSKGNDNDTKRSTSSDLMKQALMVHPSIVTKLVAKVPLKEQFWTRIINHSFFRSDQTGVPSLDHLVNLYIERNYIIWKIPDLQKMLRSAAEVVIETLESNKSEANDWACVRKEAFSSEKNEYVHLLVSDFSDFVPTVPPEALHDFVVDPRMREAQHMEQFANPSNARNVTRDVANRSTLAVLLESMLPWAHYGDRVDGGGNEDGDQPNGDGQGHEEQ